MSQTHNRREQVVGFQNPQAQLAPFFAPGMGPQPLVVGSVPRAVPPAMFPGPVNPASSVSPLGPAPQHEGYEKRTKGLKRPDQPDRPIPPPCEEPAEVVVKLATCKNIASYAGRVVGGINPLWTVAELKQHLELQANLGGTPADKQALRMDRPDAPGFDSAVSLDDGIVLKDIGLDHGAPACTIWLERRVESSGGVPAMAVAPAGAQTGSQQLLPFSTSNGNQLQHQLQQQLQRRQKLLQRQHQRQLQFQLHHHQQQQQQQWLQYQQQQVQQPALPELGTPVNDFQGPIVRPSQLRGGGTGAFAVAARGESVGRAGQGAARQSGSVGPANLPLRQRTSLVERRWLSHRQQQHPHHRIREPREQRSRPKRQQQQPPQRALPAQNMPLNPAMTPALPLGGGGEVPVRGAPAVLEVGPGARLLALQNGAGVSATGLEQQQQQQQPQQQPQQPLGQIGAELDDSPIAIDNGPENNDNNGFLTVQAHIRPEPDVSAIINGSRILTQRRQRQEQQEQEQLLAAAAAVNQDQNDPANNTEESNCVLELPLWTTLDW